MADIIQLKENGVIQYTKAHVQGLDGIDGALVKTTGNEDIGGTKNFTGAIMLNSKRLLTVDDLPANVTSLTVGGGNTGTVRLYQQGRVILIYFVGLNGKSSGGNGTTILTIPAAYRTPNSFEHLIGSTDRSALMSAAIGLGADGTVKWLRNANYGSDYTFVVPYIMG